MEERRKSLEGEWSPRNPRVFSGYGAESCYVAWWEHHCAGCGEKHEWEAMASKRFKGSNCPHCFGKRGSKPICFCRSLAAVRPDLAAEWSLKNEVAPGSFTPYSGREVLWEHICGCGLKHEWKALIIQRFRGYSRCPRCVGKGDAVICPCRSLSQLRPDLDLEWHPKNITAASAHDLYSKAKVWWKCLREGHAWEEFISKRTGERHKNCPVCNDISRHCKILSPGGGARASKFIFPRTSSPHLRIH